MSKYITCEAELNFPVPDVARLVARMRELYDGKAPVNVDLLVREFGVSDGAIRAVLLRAQRSEMVRQVTSVGWMPLTTLPN